MSRTFAGSPLIAYLLRHSAFPREKNKTLFVIQAGVARPPRNAGSRNAARTAIRCSIWRLRFKPHDAGQPMVTILGLLRLPRVAAHVNDHGTSRVASASGLNVPATLRFCPPLHLHVTQLVLSEVTIT